MEKREPSYTVGGNVNWSVTTENSMEVPYKTKNTGKTMVRRDTCIPMFIAALFTIAKTWKLPKYPSTVERINKM